MTDSLPHPRDEPATVNPAVEERRDRLRQRLADELSANPTMGDLSARAESLTAARELAEEQSELVGDLVPTVAETVLAVTPDTRNKGQAVLLGRFGATIRRNGMAALAEATSGLPTGLADEHATDALRAATAVLEQTTALGTTQHALRTVGAVAAAQPGATVAQLDETLSGDVHTSLCTVLESVLAQTSERDRLRWVLRTVALLAVQDATRQLVVGLSPSVLPSADYAEGIGERAFRIQAWAHVCRRELGHESPVDPAQLWADLDRGIGISSADPGPGIVWWLLADYAAGELPDDIDTRFASVVQQEHARARLGDAVALPEPLVDTRRLVHGAAAALDDPDAKRRTEGARALVSLVGTPLTSTPLLRLVIDAFTEALEDPNLLSSIGVATELATLADTPSVATSLRHRAVDALTTALTVDHEGTRWLAAQELGAELDAPVIDRSHRTRAVETLEQLLCRDPESLTSPLLVELAAKQLRAIASDETLPAAVRDRAARALLEALTYDKHSNPEQIQGSAADQLMKLVGTDVLSADHHGRLYDSLVSTLNAFQPKLGERGAEGLATLAATASVSQPLRRNAVEALVDALKDTGENPLETIGLRTRVRVALALTGLADTDFVTTDVLEQARKALTDVDGAGWPVKETAVDGLGELVANDSTPLELRERALSDLVAALDSVTGLGRGRDVRRESAKGLATAEGYETVAESTVLSVIDALSAVLDDAAGRAPAALGVRNICESNPRLASRLGRARIERFGAELATETPAPTRDLLSALAVLAEDSPAVLSPVRGDLNRVLADESPPNVQIQALEVYSWLE